MKKTFKIIIAIAVFLLHSTTIYSQNQLIIPTTITGGTYNITLAEDSVQFLSGKRTHTNGYNGNYLGPTLIFEKGEIVKLKVTNKLEDSTTTHWHGLHIAPENDGGPHSIIAPNSSWSPTFTVMDKASTYWYHPHLHTKTGEQVMKGAAGLIIVRDNEESALALPRKYGVDDFPIVVQTQQFDIQNQVVVDGMRDSITMVNGVIDPFVDMPAQVVRMRILNADQERNYNFGFTGSKTFSIIGSDGGLLSAPVNATRVRLAPGERAEILLNLDGMNGQTIDLMSYASELKMGIQGGPTMKMPNGMPMMLMNSPLNGMNYNILKINIKPPTTNPVTSVPSSLVTVVKLKLTNVNTTRRIEFTPKANPTPMEAMDGPFFFNGESFKMNRVDQKIRLGNTEVWKLVNKTMVAHPFHIHDVQFFILDINGVPPTIDKQGRKDVVSVGPKDSIRFITKFDDFYGTTPFMYHCHNLMHEDGGMMGQFIVDNSASLRGDILGSEFNIYPNPALDQITIGNTKNIEINKIRLFSAVGEEVISEDINNSSSSIKLNLGKNKSGIYILHIITPNTSITKNIIIE